MLANRRLGDDRIALSVTLGAVATTALMAVFLVYQRRRYRGAEAVAMSRERPVAASR